MKKLLLVAALTALAATAHASKAREAALQGSETASNDIQDFSERPNRMFTLPDMATLEFGPSMITFSALSTPVALGTGTLASSTTALSSNAEGGIIRHMDNHKLGVYLGKQSEAFTWMTSGGLTSAASGMSTASGRVLDNPLTVFYATKAGDLTWGANVFYANSSKNTAGDGYVKSAQGIAFGANTDKWEAYANLGLGASSKAATGSEALVGTSSFRLGGGMWFGDLYAFAKATSFGGTHTTAAGVDDMKLAVSVMQVGVEAKTKGDSSHFFYGVSYQTITEANTATGSQGKAEISQLPLIFGFEGDATSWLSLRGSITQPVLIGSAKYTTTAGASANNTLTDATTLKAGGSFKFTKMNVDFLLAAANTVASGGTAGQLNLTNFGYNTSLTYYF